MERMMWAGGSGEAEEGLVGMDGTAVGSGGLEVAMAH